MSKKDEQEVVVQIPKIEIQQLQVKIIGDAPLIVHKWSEKAKKEILDKQMKKASKGKEAKDPEMDFYHSMYWLNDIDEETATKDDYAKLIKSGDARFGFPSVAFKACAVNAGYQQGILAKKTTARGAFHIQSEFVEIFGKPYMREDMVRVGMGTADIRYRGEYRDWYAILNIAYNKNAISADQIINLINMGGFANGVGEWRPEKDGQFGTFHVALDGE
jgi:hypothetical protein